MSKTELQYVIKDGDKVLTNKVHTDPTLYPNLTNNLRNHISNILPRTRFWTVQNNIKIFHFLYQEAEKQLTNG